MLINYIFIIAMNNPQGVIAMNNSQTIILRALARRISWDPSLTLRM